MAEQKNQFRILRGDCVERMRELPDNSVHAVVTDPPYGLSKQPDMAEVMRHWLAGFEIRDQMMWIYSGGYPKGLDVSKAIDRQRHDRDQVLQVTAWVRQMRDHAGLKNADIDRAFGFNGMAGHWTSQASQPSVPTLEQVPQLLELMGLAAEDMPEEISRLLIELNGKKGTPGEAWFRREVVGKAKGKDSSKVRLGMPLQDSALVREYDITAPATEAAKQWEGWNTALRPAHEPIVLARKPLTGSVAHNVQAHGAGAMNIDATRITWPGTDEPERWPSNVLLDGTSEVMGDIPAGARRFFYCPKATQEDRTEGGLVENTHPTVKPTTLMRYLVRMVTPPGGTVLDPYTGSGSTGKATILEGFEFIGCELIDEHADIAEARMQAQRSVCAAPPSGDMEQITLDDQLDWVGASS